LRPFTPAARFGDSPYHLRFVPDPAGGLAAAVHTQLERRVFRLSTRSNRTGFRFEGDPLPTTPDPDRLSEPTAPGAIQLPPDGLPIMLMADRNTTGGYPRLGHLVSADRARAAQLWPGDAVAFVAVTQSAAQTATRRDARTLARAYALVSATVAVSSPAT
jgi:allophanate hydrolase subunit 2